MSVELEFNGVVDGVTKSNAQTLLGEVIDADGTTSSSGGTYSLHNLNYVGEHDRVVLRIELTDGDDSDYPNVKNDLAATVAGFTVDFGTKTEVKDSLTGSVQ